MSGKEEEMGHDRLTDTSRSIPNAPHFVKSNHASALATFFALSSGPYDSIHHQPILARQQSR